MINDTLGHPNNHQAVGVIARVVRDLIRLHITQSPRLRAAETALRVHDPVDLGDNADLNFAWIR